MTKTRKKLLIVDGYNVLRSGSRYSQINLPDYTDDTFNAAREQLVNDVISFAGSSMQAIIVYDAANNPYSSGKEETVGGVKIIFSRAGSTADKTIEKLAHDAKERGIEALVVTSDATIQDTVFGGGVDRMSAEGFCQEMSIHFEDTESDEQVQVSHKMTLASRLSPETVEALKRLRDKK